MITKVRWADKAISDRQGIFQLNAERSSASFAKSEDKKISDAVERIRNNNHIGRNDLHPIGLLYQLAKRYKILYRLDVSVISIERIFN